MKSFAFLFCLFFVIVNLWTIKDGHNWGDDFSQYLIGANNLITGQPFFSGTMLDNPVSYPPGFSILLAPFLKVFGLNFKVLKLLNILFWYGSIAALYPIFVRIGGGRFATLSSIFLAGSSVFFMFKQNVLSDVPFFFFVCCAFYAFSKYRDRLSSGWFFVFILSLSSALWTRSAGIALFISALFYFLVIQRNLRLTCWIALALIVNEVVLVIWMGVRPGFFLIVEKAPEAFLFSIYYNFPQSFLAVWHFLCPPQSPISSIISNGINPVVSVSSLFLYLGCLYLLVKNLSKGALSFLYCFSFFYLTMLIVRSGFAIPVESSVRFIFPLLPAFLIGCYQGFQWVQAKLGGRNWVNVFIIFLVLLNAGNMITNWNFNDDAIKRPVNQELILWVKQNLAENERYMFWKPRGMALLTGRLGTTISPGFLEHFSFDERINRLDISYVILSKTLDPAMIAFLESHRLWIFVWENSEYRVYKRVPG